VDILNQILNYKTKDVGKICVIRERNCLVWILGINLDRVSG